MISGPDSVGTVAFVGSGMETFKGGADAVVSRAEHGVSASEEKGKGKKKEAVTIESNNNEV